MIRLIVVSFALASGLRLRLSGSDAVVQPIAIEEITEEPNPNAPKVDKDGNPIVNTTPSPYKTNLPSVYAIEPVLNSTLGENEMRVNATAADVDLCTMLTGQVRIDAGCLQQDILQSMIFKAAFYALLVAIAGGVKLGGDCTSGGGPGCIQPLSLDMPEELNPTTIVTSTDSNGFVSAQAIAGDIPEVGPETKYEGGESDQDIALRFTISSPSLEPPPPPPPMLTCDYDQCTTSTTLAPGARPVQF